MVDAPGSLRLIVALKGFCCVPARAMPLFRKASRGGGALLDDPAADSGGGSQQKHLVEIPPGLKPGDKLKKTN